MVRRLVIPIDIPATVVAGIHPRGRFVTDPAADQEGLAPGGAAVETGSELRRIESDAFAAAVVHSKVRSPSDPAVHTRAAAPSRLARAPCQCSAAGHHHRSGLWQVHAPGGSRQADATGARSGTGSKPAIETGSPSSHTSWRRCARWHLGSGSGTVSLLQQVGVLNATRDLTLDTLLAELESVATEPLSMVLDDFHTVHDSEDVRAIVARFLEHAPAGTLAGDRGPRTGQRSPWRGSTAQAGSRNSRPKTSDSREARPRTSSPTPMGRRSTTTWWTPSTSGLRVGARACNWFVPRCCRFGPRRSGRSSGTCPPTPSRCTTSSPRR